MVGTIDNQRHNNQRRQNLGKILMGLGVLTAGACAIIPLAKDKQPPQGEAIIGVAVGGLAFLTGVGAYCWGGVKNCWGGVKNVAYKASSCLRCHKARPDVVELKSVNGDAVKFSSLCSDEFTPSDQSSSYSFTGELSVGSERGDTSHCK